VIAEEITMRIRDQIKPAIRAFEEAHAPYPIRSLAHQASQAAATFHDFLAQLLRQQGIQ
jgi:ATP-dependent exoDNAse (exonuclease V) beta subunit